MPYDSTFDIQSDQPPDEPLAETAAEGYAKHLEPGFAAKYGAGGPDNASSFVGRAVERGSQSDASRVDAWLFGSGAQGGVPQMESPTISGEDADKRFSPPGEHLFSKPISEGLARIIGRQRREEIEREAVHARFAENHNPVVTFGVDTAAFLSDPLNLATMFVPGLGEERIAAFVGGRAISTVAGRTAVRAVAGATAFDAAQLPLSAMKYGLGQEEHSDYGMRAVLGDLAMGAVLGAAGHAIGGGLREIGWRHADSLMNMDAASRHAALRTSVAQVVEGKPIDVSAVYDTAMAQRAETALRKWAAEHDRVQGEQDAALLRADASGTEIEKQQARLAEHNIRLEALAQEHASLGQEIENASARLKETFDPATQERLNAIEDELTAPGPALSAARKTALQREQTMLTEGQNKSLDTLEVARTQAQIEGLKTQQARVEARQATTEARATVQAAETSAKARADSLAFGFHAAVAESREAVVHALTARTIRRYAAAIGAPLERGEADLLARKALRSRTRAGDVKAEATAAVESALDAKVPPSRGPGVVKALAAKAETNKTQSELLAKGRMLEARAAATAVAQSKAEAALAAKTAELESLLAAEPSVGKEAAVAKALAEKAKLEATAKERTTAAESAIRDKTAAATLLAEKTRLEGRAAISDVLNDLHTRLPGSVYPEAGQSIADIVERGAQRIREKSPTPASIVAKERAIERNGYAAGIPQRDFDAVREQLYPAKDLSAPKEPNAKPHRTNESLETGDMAKEIATLERAAMENGVEMHPEEHATIAAADASALKAEAYAQAAECLIEAGL